MRGINHIPDDHMAHFAAVALSLSREYPLKKHLHLHTFTRPQILACFILKLHLDISFRELSRMIDGSPDLLGALGMKRPPNHSLFFQASKLVHYPSIALKLMPRVIVAMSKPKAVDARLKRIIDAWPTLTETQREKLDAVLGFSSNRSATAVGFPST